MVVGWRQEQPALRQVGRNIVVASHPKLGQVRLECEGATELLFTENESNADRLWGQANTSPYVKIGGSLRTHCQKLSIIQTLLLLVMPAMASSRPFGAAIA